MWSPRAGLAGLFTIISFDWRLAGHNNKADRDFLRESDMQICTSDIEQKERA